MARVRAKVRDTDKGWKQIKKELAKYRNAYVKVGLPTKTGEKEHDGGKDGEMSGVTVAAVGWFNEFGTKTIPERSFIRSTHDENIPEIVAMKKRLLAQLYEKKMGVLKALRVLGTYMKKEIQAKITSLDTPPNAPSTIARKGSSNPLIATGQMRQSVDYEVVVGRRFRHRI